MSDMESELVKRIDATKEDSNMQASCSVLRVIIPGVQCAKVAECHGYIRSRYQYCHARI